MKTTSLFRRFSPVPVFAAALVLGACGGGGGSGGSATGDGGGDGSGSGTTTESASPDTYMAFYSADTLWMIDPDDPLNQLSVDNPIQSPFNNTDEVPPAAVLGGNWDSTDQVVENPHITHVVYGDTTVNMFRVATDLSGDPTATEGPEQMSSANENLVCGLEVAPGYGDPLQGIVAFLAEDADSNCDPDTRGDGEWKVSRLGAESGDSAASLGGEPVRSVLGDDGNPLGFLIDTGNRLLRYDLESDSTEEVKLLSFGAWAAGALPGGPGAVFVDGELHVYERQSDDSNRFVDLEYTLQDDTGGTDGVKVPREHAHDAETLYFIDDSSLHVADLAGESHTVISDRSGAVEETAIGLQLYRVIVTPDHVAWFYPTSLSNTHLAVYERDNLSGAPVVDEDLGDLRSTVNPPILRRTGGWLFYSRITADGSPEAVARAADDSSTETFDNARWLGGSSNQVTPDLSDSFEVAQMLQGVSSATDFAGASIKSVPGDAPGADMVDHGTLPADAVGAQLFLGTGSTRLLQVLSGSSADPDRDVYFFDSTATDSLTQVDPDPKDNDRAPVLFF